MELITIREAARRLGVSDTALHKARKSGRITVQAGDEDPANGRPRLRWPDVRDQYLANTDEAKRTHIGGQGSSRRAADEPTTAPTLAAQTAGQHAAAAQPAPDGQDQRMPAGGPSLAQSKAVKEAYLARLAKLDYEERSGKLVPADDVKVAWFKLIKAAQTRIMGVPAAVKTRCPELPLAAVAAIEAVCREALEDLANGSA